MQVFFSREQKGKKERKGTHSEFDLSPVNFGLSRKIYPIPKDSRVVNTHGVCDLSLPIIHDLEAMDHIAGLSHHIVVENTPLPTRRVVENSMARPRTGRQSDVTVMLQFERHRVDGVPVHLIGLEGRDEDVLSPGINEGLVKKGFGDGGGGEVE